MAEPGRTIYVAGAGIAGLTLALALAKFGLTTIVLERSTGVQEFGAGLQISPNARLILNRLGLDEALGAVAFEPQGIDVYPFRRPRPLVTLQLGEAARKRFGAQYAVAHRADLLDTLYKAARRFANIDIMFGVKGFDAQSHAKGVSVIIEEPAGGARSGRAFALVGADGVNSFTRIGLLDGPPPTYSGYVAWRTLLPMSALARHVNLHRTSLLFGPGFHAVLYPLPHRGQINVALFAKLDRRIAFGAEPPKAPDLPKQVLPSAMFDAILSAAGDGWTFWPLSAVDTPNWSAGAIGLVGDAAHAMLPFQAQGAAMGIEDAAVLAPLLATSPDAQTAFARYAALRQARTRKIAALSARNGFAFHLEWPFTLARDLVIAAGGDTSHLSRLAWVYGHDAAPEAGPLSPTER